MIRYTASFLEIKTGTKCKQKSDFAAVAMLAAC